MCITSHNYSRKKEQREGLGSESTYGLMTTSFSQKSGISSLYDNPAVSITPQSRLSRSESYHKYRRTTSAGQTPTSPIIHVEPDLHLDDGTGIYRLPQRTVSDPLICSAPSENM